MVDRLTILPLNVAPIPRLALREAECAAAINVSPSWLRREALAGRVPSMLVSGVRLYSVDELRIWLADQTQRPQVDASGEGRQ